MRQPRVFVGRAFVIPPREVAHGEWRPPPGSSRPDGRSELHRQPDREPAGADRPDANPRWGLDCPPMLAPDNRTDDRAQDHPGGHRDDKQPAYQAATSPAGDDRGEYAERRPAEEAKGDAATPMSAAACARAPADLEPRPALARESHRRAVRTPHDDGGAVDRFETPGPHVAPPVGRGDANPNARSQGGRFLGAESAERQAQREREAGADAFYGSPPAGENSGSVSSGFQEQPPVTLSHFLWSGRRGALQRPVPPVAFPPVRAAKTPYN